MKMHCCAAPAAHKSAHPAASAKPQSENSAKTFPETRSPECLPKVRTSHLPQTSRNDFSRPPLFLKRLLLLSGNENPPAGNDRDGNRLRASTAALPERPPAWQSLPPPACNRSSAAARILRPRVSNAQ